MPIRTEALPSNITVTTSGSRVEANIASPHHDALRPVELPPLRIARSINVAAVPLSAFRTGLASDLALGASVTDRPWIEAHLIQKSSGSKVSSGLVMAPGGTAYPHERFSQAALSEVAEETVSTSVAEDATLESWQGQVDHKFQFMIGGGTGRYANPRVLDIRVLPVESDDFSLNKPREKLNGPTSEDKIARIVRLNPYELQALFDKGWISRGEEAFLAASHMTTADIGHDKIDIDRANSNERKQLLNNVMYEVHDYDRQLKATTLQEINRVRRIKQQEALRTKLQEAGMSLDDYDISKIDTSEIEREFAAAQTLDECDLPELERGFVAAQMRMALTDEAASERPGQPAPKDSLLKALPYLVSELPVEELPNLLLSLPNRETVHAMMQIRDGLRSGIQVLADELPGQEYVHNGTDPIVKMRSLWPAFRALHPVERKRILDLANEAVVSSLAQLTGVRERDVVAAKGAVDEFHEFIKDDLKSMGDIQLFQELNPSNEVVNADIFTLMAYTVGLHPNRDSAGEGTFEERVRRFESLRHLALILIGTEVAQEIRTADNALFEGALDSMTHPPVRKAVAIDESGRTLNVFGRQTKEDVIGLDINLRVDERLKKKITSGIRKRIQDPEMFDIFSTNDILERDIPPEYQDTAELADYLEQYLNRAAAYREAYMTQVLDYVGGEVAGWKLSVVEGTQRTAGINNARSVIEALRASKAPLADILSGKVVVLPPQQFGGKRTGSSAEKIIRDKFVLHLEGPNGEEEYLEKCIYPFESTDSTGNEAMRPLQEAGLWGWKEKVEDDSKGPYKTERIRGRDPKHPTRHSLFGLLYPGHLFGGLAERIKEMQIKTRKSTNGMSFTAVAEL